MSGTDRFTRRARFRIFEKVQRAYLLPLLSKRVHRSRQYSSGRAVVDKSVVGRGLFFFLLIIHTTVCASVGRIFLCHAPNNMFFVDGILKIAVA